jgi:hypothetical protein
LRGLDGIQGPVYVGTGCVFNRTALYGYEPPAKQKKSGGGFFSSLCGGRKKTSKSKKKSSEKKKSQKHVDSSVPVFNLEDIEEGVEGTILSCCMNILGFNSLFFLYFVASTIYAPSPGNNLLQKCRKRLRT